MTLRILPSTGYGGASKDAAIANIQADVGPMYVADAYGVKRLDRAALREYLTAQFIEVAEQWGPGTSNYTNALAAAHNVNVTELVNALDDALSPERLRQKFSYFPAAAMYSASSIVTTINTLRAKAQTFSDALTAKYNWTQEGQGLYDFVRTFFNAQNLDALVPAPVERLLDSRTYRCAYSTDKGELSKPSDASPIITIDQNDSPQVTAPAPPAGRFIDTVLWYRSNNGSSSAAFQYVASKPVAEGLTFVDTVQAAALGENVPSIEWDEPPADLRGLRAHPSGFAVGFTGNTLCPSVQNRFYAFPITWRKTTTKPIVGIEVAGQTVFVGTQGEPVLVTGADPAFLSAEKVKGGQPCRAARSIVATNIGFLYAGADGIAVCNGVGETPVLTRAHFTKEQWEALKPESIFAIEHDGCYYFWWNNGASSGCYSLGIETGRLSAVDIAASTVFRNSSNGKLYAVSGTQIVEVFGGAAKRTGYWTSPRIPSREGPSWLKVVSDYAAGNITVRWRRYLEDGSISLATYTASNRKPQRTHAAPAGMDEYEIEVEGQSATALVQLAGSSAELKS